LLSSKKIASLAQALNSLIVLIQFISFLFSSISLNKIEPVKFSLEFVFIIVFSGKYISPTTNQVSFLMLVGSGINQFVFSRSNVVFQIIVFFHFLIFSLYQMEINIFLKYFFGFTFFSISSKLISSKLCVFISFKLFFFVSFCSSFIFSLVDGPKYQRIFISLFSSKIFSFNCNL